MVRMGTAALAVVMIVTVPGLAGAEAPIEQADEAVEREAWEEALAALERAYVLEPDPYYLYRRVLVLEKMGEFPLALEVLRENRAEMLASDRVNDLVVVEERIQAAAATDVSESTRESSGPWPLASLLTGGVVAAGGTALLVVGSLDLARLRCADVAARDARCSEASDVPPLSNEAFDARVRRAAALRTTGAVLLPVGVAAALGGYLLFADGERVSMSVDPVRRNVSLAWHF